MKKAISFIIIAISLIACSTPEDEPIVIPDGKKVFLMPLPSGRMRPNAFSGSDINVVPRREQADYRMSHQSDGRDMGFISSECDTVISQALTDSDQIFMTQIICD